MNYLVTCVIPLFLGCQNVVLSVLNRESTSFAWLKTSLLREKAPKRSMASELADVLR